MRASKPRPHQSTPSRARHRQRLRWLLWRFRFLIAAAAGAIAIMVVVNEVRPDTTPTGAVVALRTAVPAGEAIESRHLHVVQVPTHLIPDAVYTNPRDVSGRSAAVALPATTVLSPNLVSGGAARERAPEGTVIVPVRLSDVAITRFLHVGDRVDLVLVAEKHYDGLDENNSDPAARINQGEITTLAKRALILPSPAEENPEPTGLLGGSSAIDDAAAFLLVAVSPKEAQTLTAAARAGYIGAVLVE